MAAILDDLFCYFWSTSPPTEFQVNWHFVQKKRKREFLRWRPRRQSFISDRKNFSYFLINKSPWCFLPISSQLALWFRRRAKNRFSSGHAGHLELRFGTILIIFLPTINPKLPTKLQVNLPFGSWEEEKNRFLRWRPPWISDRYNFRNFSSSSHPDASY